MDAKTEYRNLLRAKIYLFIRAVFASSRRAIQENIRAFPWSFFASRLLTSFFVILFAYFISHVLFNKVSFMGMRSSDYLTYIVVGMGLQTYADAVLLGVGRSLIVERRMGTLESLYLTPSSQYAYLVGVMLQQVLVTTVDFLIIMIVGFVFGAHFDKVNLPTFFLALAVGQVGFFGMGILLAAVMLYLRETYITQNTVLAVLFLICGVLFPIEYLPEWVQKIASMIPLTHALILARGSALLGLSLNQQSYTFFALLSLSLFYCGIGIFFVQKVRRIALETSLS